MDGSRKRPQVRVTVFENEPLALLAQQRLSQEGILCVVRSLGAGPGGWGVATNLPHAIYVKATDEMRARQILDLTPREIAEREGVPPQPAYPLPVMVVAFSIITAGALILGILELLVGPLFR